MRRARRWMATGLALGLGSFLLVAFDQAVTRVLPALDLAVFELVGAWQRSGVPVHAAGEWLSLIGDWRTTTTVVAGTAAWMLWRGERMLAIWCVGIASASSLFLYGLKLLFGRERPPLVEELGLQIGPSFPSGHTFGAASAIGAAILLGTEVHARVVRKGARKTIHLWVLAVAAWAVLTLLTGLGRVLLQRHWLTDVVASWALGLALVSSLLLALTRHQGKGDPGPRVPEAAETEAG